MENTHPLRGISAMTFYTDDIKAATKWYSELSGVEPYAQRPDKDNPTYIEFRIGDQQQGLIILDKQLAPKTGAAGPGGAVIYWHADDIEGMLEKAKMMGAREYEPLVKYEAGLLTASVIDPFGNILGLMYSPHFLDMVGIAHEKEKVLSVAGQPR